MTDSGTTYVVTLKDVANDLATRMDRTTEAVHQLELTLATIQPLTSQTADHEARIRVIEASVTRFKYIFSSIGIVAGGLSGWITNVITNVHH
jgi:hypothetical protein